MNINCPILNELVPATQAMITALVPQLPDDEDSFLILEQSDQIYMQVLGLGQDDYLIEFRDGHAETHYQLDEHLTREDTIATLISYMQGNDDWREQYSYSKMSF